MINKAQNIETIIGAATKKTDAPLLLTVSGGADSMSLFHACRRIGIKFEVAHCNFHLRGEESNRDEFFVKDICKKHNIICHIKHFDVPAFCDKKHISTEMACRELRYNWFRQLKSEINASRIVTAHNADDNIETLLLNLFRGSGIEGLKGMALDNGEILRPLLEINRKEIEDYLYDIGETFITDSTNLQTDYKRNFIRNTILPLIESRWEGVRKSLLQTQQNIAGAYSYYREKMDNLLLQNPDFLPFDILSNAPHKPTLLYEFLKHCKANHTIVNEIARSIDSPSRVGKQWILENHTVIIERNGIAIINQNQRFETPNYSITVLPYSEQIFSEIKQNRDHNIIFLPGKISEYRFRKPKKGDRISPLGLNGSQLISDIVKDAKLTNIDKINLWILEDIKTNQIIWVCGIKRSRHRLVSDSDKEIIKIEFQN